MAGRCPRAHSIGGYCPVGHERGFDGVDDVMEEVRLVPLVAAVGRPDHPIGAAGRDDPAAGRRNRREEMAAGGAVTGLAAGLLGRVHPAVKPPFDAVLEIVVDRRQQRRHAIERDREVGDPARAKPVGDRFQRRPYVRQIEEGLGDDDIVGSRVSREVGERVFRTELDLERRSVAVDAYRLARAVGITVPIRRAVGDAVRRGVDEGRVGVDGRIPDFGVGRPLEDRFDHRPRPGTDLAECDGLVDRRKRTAKRRRDAVIPCATVDGSLGIEVAPKRVAVRLGHASPPSIRGGVTSGVMGPPSRRRGVES